MVVLYKDLQCNPRGSCSSLRPLKWTVNLVHGMWSLEHAGKTIVTFFEKKWELPSFYGFIFLLPLFSMSIHWWLTIRSTELALFFIWMFKSYYFAWQDSEDCKWGWHENCAFGLRVEANKKAPCNLGHFSLSIPSCLFGKWSCVFELCQYRPIVFLWIWWLRNHQVKATK